MTKRGHFILNGCARVIVNQMIRSPGIYYQKKIYENFSDKWSEKPENTFTRYYADLICNRGTWLRIEMDKYNRIWAQMKRVPKIPIMWFLISVGLTDKIILKSIIDSKILLYNFQENSLNQQKKSLPYVTTPPAAWNKIYNIVFSKKIKKTQNKQKIKKKPKKTNINKKTYKDLNFPELISLKKTIELKSEQGRKWIFNKFMNPRTYDLGKIGRLNFNNKLKLTISSNITTLTPQDFLAATNNLILVSKGLRELDDIDHLKNRRVRTSGELIQMQIGVGLVRLEKTIREKMNLLLITNQSKKKDFFKKKNKKEKSIKGHTQLLSLRTSCELSISNIMNTKPFNGALREFFGTSPLSQFMDQINPLAELTHKRRLSSMGPGGVTRDSATLAIRGIHPSHYGRICPVETPEGKNTCLVNSLTAYARVNTQGYI
jgi:DNA-directed RNA polymerase subunit beta